ncbi:hypothetical protein FRAHR75_90042 [Frankia sp. Hr75.2]|nr:hypothetical protein FRAHR75_90042 [Frankia sp. Hr75.2]
MITVAFTILDLDMVEAAMSADPQWAASALCGKLDDAALAVDRFPDGIVADPIKTRERVKVSLSTEDVDALRSALHAHQIRWTANGHGGETERKRRILAKLDGVPYVRPARANGAFEWFWHPSGGLLPAMMASQSVAA